MNKKWRKVEDLITFSGKGITPKYVNNSSIIVLNQKCIRNNKIDYTFSQYTDDTKNINEKKFVKAGDILLNSTGQGTAGRVAFVDKLPTEKKVIVDSHILIVRLDNYYEAQCLGYSLYSYESNIQSFMDGSTGQGELDKVRVFNLLTSLTENPSDQKNIAKVLSDLDAKIELNNKINQKLEAMAKTLYDYWFVQFDFPCLPKDYSPAHKVNADRPSGQVNPNSELAVKIKSVCTYKQTGNLPLPNGKSWFVYVVECADGSLYKGMTNDLYRRYFEHYTGQGAKWTKTHKPKRIIHYEEFGSQTEAAEREKELKTGNGRTWLKREYEKLLEEEATYSSSANKNGLPAPLRKAGSPAPIRKAGSPAHQTRLMKAGKMVYNNQLKREIPVGWEVKILAEIANITMGQSPSGSSYNDEKNGMIFFQGSTDFGWRYPTVRQYTTEPKREAKMGDVLLSVRAPVGTLNIADNSCCIGRGLAALNSKDGYDSYLYYVLEYLKQIFDYRNNAGTTFGAITKDDLFSLTVIYPTDVVLKEYNKFAKDFNKTILNNHKQNQQLVELRDWLLPMLMNGQVTVAEAKQEFNLAAETTSEYK